MGITSPCGPRIAQELDTPIRISGKPACKVSENGTGFTIQAILTWADETTMPLHDIDPGKPQQNAIIKIFDGSTRDELL